MVSNIFLGLIVLWAVVFAGLKIKKIYTQTKSGKQMECSCSGCSRCCSARK